MNCTENIGFMVLESDGNPTVSVPPRTGVSAWAVVAPMSVATVIAATVCSRRIETGSDMVGFS